MRRWLFVVTADVGKQHDNILLSLWMRNRFPFHWNVKTYSLTPRWSYRKYSGTFTRSITARNNYLMLLVANPLRHYSAVHNKVHEISIRALSVCFATCHIEHLSTSNCPLWTKLEKIYSSTVKLNTMPHTICCKIIIMWQNTKNIMVILTHFVVWSIFEKDRCIQRRNNLQLTEPNFLN